MPPPKPPKPKKVLHFFPGPKALIWAIDDKPVLKTEAWGGEAPVPGVDYGPMKPQPTTPGSYIIHSYAPYVTRTWPLSRIAWGTRIKLDPTNKYLLYEVGSNRWDKVENKVPHATPDAIRALYREHYPKGGYRDPDGDGIPEVWLFNDFGPMAVRYFRDKNHNRKKDADEALSGEMIHTTPDNEAETALGTTPVLGASHGCIHVPPLSRDAFRTAGAFDRGNDLVIHPYSEVVPVNLR
jgi:hypothetical protein